ncbi:hypothetical protein FN846DRAFT_280840 [Sphaerosporella brunnea]|uniref:Uncharacterized protein n=1 Tax=Sphaerosporella brunnea TaxID=1250544 RepID=A0A5J5ELF1_9PEZI|nr:hypothetical protein FN846DRAFT_280840 [Sphaerosporella brunnea]
MEVSLPIGLFSVLFFLHSPIHTRGTVLRILLVARVRIQNSRVNHFISALGLQEKYTCLLVALSCLWKLLELSCENFRLPHRTAARSHLIWCRSGGTPRFSLPRIRCALLVTNFFVCIRSRTVMTYPLPYPVRPLIDTIS